MNRVLQKRKDRTRRRRKRRGESGFKFEFNLKSSYFLLFFHRKAVLINFWKFSFVCPRSLSLLFLEARRRNIFESNCNSNVRRSAQLARSILACIILSSFFKTRLTLLLFILSSRRRTVYYCSHEELSRTFSNIFFQLL